MPQLFLIFELPQAKRFATKEVPLRWTTRAMRRTQKSYFSCMIDKIAA